MAIAGLVFIWTGQVFRPFALVRPAEPVRELSTAAGGRRSRRTLVRRGGQLGFNASHSRKVLQVLQELAVTSSDVSEKNCSKSNSLKRGGKASWPTKRRAKAGMALGSGRWTVNVPSRLPLTQCAEHPEGEAQPETRMDARFQGESAPICTKSTITPRWGVRSACASAWLRSRRMGSQR
jgi:hypothetical protein